MNEFQVVDQVGNVLSTHSNWHQACNALRQCELDAATLRLSDRFHISTTAPLFQPMRRQPVLSMRESGR